MKKKKRKNFYQKGIGFLFHHIFASNPSLCYLYIGNIEHWICRALCYCVSNSWPNFYSKALSVLSLLPLYSSLYLNFYIYNKYKAQNI